MKHLNEDSPQKNSKSTLYLVLLIIAVSILLLTYIFYIPSIKNKIYNFSNQHPLINPSASLIDKKNLLVNFQPLRESLTQKYAKRDDYLVSLYFEYLPTGANISINKDDEIWPASLIKIPVAMAVMKKIENQEWKLKNELVILDEDKSSEFGNLYKEPAGTTMTIEEFLKESLVNSDNTAHFVLLRNIENDELEDVYVHLGLDDIISALKKSPDEESLDNRITAKRYSVFFRSLYNSTYLTPEYSQKFLEILREAPKEYLSSGLPDDTIFVHKTGIRTDEAVYTDAGIIYIPNRPYLLTVMIQKKDKTSAPKEEINNLFKDISGEIYDYVSKAK
ncbi:hypothetical protein A2V71_01410 [Candidatus Berkelbacteria bacterium RBG_13_40_8]|uniref:Beta-lactamase class A catalytic domain-containing protein n=1 Tax=Candidatus Berkelbacteria bacterium RBG_13_40_8 TaxID=1797467 RepID=A0A1F5DMM0_9BACT|nr:MAG: hypothetical protein A2V71_01410 [Candidatus Berkelbacteria bacterium RBG_13_40_8]